MNNWRQKSIDYLKAGQFGDRPYCCMKLRMPGDSSCSKYGLVYNDEVTEIHFVDLKGNTEGESIKFASVEAMLDAGWDVD